MWCMQIPSLSWSLKSNGPSLYYRTHFWLALILARYCPTLNIILSPILYNFEEMKEVAASMLDFCHTQVSLSRSDRPDFILSCLGTWIAFNELLCALYSWAQQLQIGRLKHTWWNIILHYASSKLAKSAKIILFWLCYKTAVWLDCLWLNNNGRSTFDHE